MSTLFISDELAAGETAEIVDLFAGPGGWSEGLRTIGRTDVGIELDRFACSTRRSAGHLTIEADVTGLDPTTFKNATGLIASPPCQALSSAGKKHGRTHVDVLTDAIRSRDWTARPHHDPNVWMALEVGRWIDELYPEWIALEQVPAALPLWEAFAEILHGDGYATWTGILDAADHGVPQRRKRAVLLAHANYRMGPPPRRPQIAGATALGLRPGPYYIGTGRDWNKETGRSQVVDISAEPCPTLTLKAGSQWHMDVDPETPRTTPRARPMELREALIVQGFPPDYPVAGGRSQALEQIGNAVPPPLAAELLRPFLAP